MDGIRPFQHQKRQYGRYPDNTYEKQYPAEGLTQGKASQEPFQGRDHPADADHRMGQPAWVAQEKVEENGGD
jgi:hypothetical protein